MQKLLRGKIPRQYIVAILLFLAFFGFATINSPKAIAYTSATGCVNGSPVNQVPVVHPKATVNVNVTAPPGMQSELDVVLKDSGGNTISTVKTCGNLTGGSGLHTVALKTAFYDLDVGSYIACINNKCTSYFQVKKNGTIFVNNTVALAVTALDVPGQFTTATIDVRMKVLDPVSDTTYGPVPTVLINANGVRSPVSNSGTQDFAKGGKPGTIELAVDYTPVKDGEIYQGCILDSTGNTTVKCSSLGLKKVNENLRFYIDLDTTESATYSFVSGSVTSPPTCGSVVTGLGWIMCPVINLLVGINDTMWALVSTLLTVNPLSQTDAIYTAWGSIRSIANVLFVIAFLIIIFSQLTGAGITNYGVKKLLPRLIICAILVNISFIVIQIAVDISNIAGIGIKNLLEGITPPNQPSWSALVGIGLAGNVATAGTLFIAAMAPEAAMWLLMPMAAMGMLGLLAALLTLIFRQAIIPILAILAPLAFVAYLLPNTEKLFKKWLDLLLPMLVMYPLAALIFGGAKFASGAIVKGHETEFWAVLVGLIVLTMPLFSLPFLVRQGGSILKAVGAGLNKIAETARAPITNFAKDMSEDAQLRYENQRPAGGLAGLGRTNTRQRRYNKKQRQDRKALNTTDLENQMNENTTGRMSDNLPPARNSAIGRQGIADRQTIRGIATANKEAMKDKEAIDVEIGNESGRRPEGMATTVRLGFAKDDAKRVETLAGIRQSRDLEHRALKIENLGLDQDLTHETNAMKSEQARTQGGRDQARQALADEDIATTDKKHAAGRYESDPTTLQVRDEKQEAEAYTKSVEDDNAALYTAASAGEDPNFKYDPSKTAAENAEKRDAGRVAGLKAGMRSETIDMLQNAKRGSDVATSATREATRQSDQNYRKSLAGESDQVGGYENNDYADAGWGVLDRQGNTIPVLDREGKPIPQFDRQNNPIGPNEVFRKTTETAKMSAGIGGDAGVVRAQANALFAADQADADEVKARVVVQTNGIPAGQRPSKAKQDFLNSLAINDSVGVRAALETLMNTGEAGQGKLQEVLEGIEPITPEQLASPEFEAIRDLQQALLKGGVKGFSIAADKWAVSGGTKTLGKMQRDPQWYAGLKEPELAQQSNAEFVNAFSSGALTAKRAKEVRDHPQSILSEGKRDLLTAIIQGKVPIEAKLKLDSLSGKFKATVNGVETDITPDPDVKPTPPAVRYDSEGKPIYPPGTLFGPDNRPLPPSGM